MTSKQLAGEIRRIEIEMRQLKSDLYDRVVALEHLRGVHAAAKADEDQAAAQAQRESD